MSSPPLIQKQRATPPSNSSSLSSRSTRFERSHEGEEQMNYVNHIHHPEHRGNVSLMDITNDGNTYLELGDGLVVDWENPTEEDIDNVYNFIQQEGDVAFLSQQLEDFALENDADGGDSDVEGEEMQDFMEVANVANAEKNETAYDMFDVNEDVFSFAIADKHVKNNIIIDEDEILKKVHRPPEGWVAPAPQSSAEPAFASLDNPGGWSDYVYTPRYKAPRGGTKTYQYHCLPTGCTVAPKDNEGRYKVGDWEFFYTGWETKLDKNRMRNGATPDNLFPEERDGYLDIDLLKRLGLDVNRMKRDGDENNPDALFFHQLLLPICDPRKLGISGDERLPFYTEVERFSNLYAFQNGWTGSYGHTLKLANVEEWVHWDGVLNRDARKGYKNRIHERFDSNSSDYDSYCDKAMSLRRYYDLKRIFKLNDNSISKPRGDPEYDPCSKFDLIYKTIVHNTIVVTKRAPADLSGDETTWPHMGYGEAQAGVVKRVEKKPGVSKGGQVCVLSATKRKRIYWYQHRHNHNPRYNDQGFTSMGPAEVRTCLESMLKYIEGQPGNAKKIFNQPFHSTWDNHFSGVPVANLAGMLGYSILFTCRRDRLPSGVPSKYLHKEKTPVVTHKTKVARMLHPVVAVKSSDNFEVVLTSFQSTSSTNIMSVNALSECKNFLEVRARGRKEKKRLYVIEQNHSRRLYLKTYSRIDSIDHLLKNIKVHYTSWKYWHSPVNHAKTLAVIIAHDMYLEVAEGKLDPALKIERPVDLSSFLDVLSKQQCEYSMRNRHYSGDEGFRCCTQQNKDRRTQKQGNQHMANMPSSSSVSTSVSKTSNKELCSSVSSSSSSTPNKVTLEQYKHLRDSGRFCFSLKEFSDHYNSVSQTNAKGSRFKTPRVCVVCSVKSCYYKCHKCDQFMHYKADKKNDIDYDCFWQFHSNEYCGLTFVDRQMVGKTESTWSNWDDKHVENNKVHIEELESKIRRTRSTTATATATRGKKRKK